MTSCCDPRKATCPEKTLVGCSIGSTVIGCTMMIVGLITPRTPIARSSTRRLWLCTVCQSESQCPSQCQS